MLLKVSKYGIIYLSYEFNLKMGNTNGKVGENIKMYLTIKQKVKHLSKNEYKTLKKLSHIAKNLTNQALYNVRQHYFNTREYLNYYDNNRLLKDSENYKALNSNMSQQILKEVDGSFKSFFALLKLKQKGQYDAKVRIPQYLEKDGFTTLIIGFVRTKNNELIIPYSRLFKKTNKEIKIKMPPILNDKKIKEIRIIPKGKQARFFEIQYTYEIKEKKLNLDKQKALAIDLGINNLATCVTNLGKSFIVDGKRLKSINQWYNKENARLQSINDKRMESEKKKNKELETETKKKSKYTNKQFRITNKRNNRVNDYMSKAARLIINYCIDNNIGNVVLGYNSKFQDDPNLGKVNNQNFKQIPFGKLKDKLKYLCKYYGITFTEQEESYTSKASFFDGDEIPVYNKDDTTNYKFSGKRIKRGLYQTKDGMLLNADVNGALNILKKSNVVSLTTLYGIRGKLEVPIRLRIS